MRNSLDTGLARLRCVSGWAPFEEYWPGSKRGIFAREPHYRWKNPLKAKSDRLRNLDRVLLKMLMNRADSLRCNVSRQVRVAQLVRATDS